MWKIPRLFWEQAGDLFFWFYDVLSLEILILDNLKEKASEGKFDAYTEAL